MLKIFCNGCDTHILPGTLAIEGKDFTERVAPTPLNEVFHLCVDCMSTALNAIARSLRP